MDSHKITIKTPQDLETLRQGGKRLARVLDCLCKTSKPGVTTEELDVMAEKLIRQAGGEPAFKGYKSRSDSRPFPTTICASLNNEVVHAPAVPSRVLKNGDILKVDIGMRWSAHNSPQPPLTLRGGVLNDPPLKIRGGAGGVMNNGLFTDMARTVIVGKTDKRTRELVKVTEKALYVGIKQVRAGNKVSHISKAIEKFVGKYGFGIVRDLVGHGVGYDVHEPPEVPNFWVDGMKDCVLQEGMVIAIEPMVNLGGWRVKVGEDGFTIITADNSPAAHFEHTVIVRKRGGEVATK